MEIRLDRRAIRQMRLAAEDAIEEGDTESLREDVVDAFTDEQIEEIERRLDNGDFYEFVREMLEEWSEDDVDELFELLESQLGDIGIDIKYDTESDAEDEEEWEAESDDDDDDDEEEEEADDDR
jgi:hypothetical protein